MLNVLKAIWYIALIACVFLITLHLVDLMDSAQRFVSTQNTNLTDTRNNLNNLLIAAKKTIETTNQAVEEARDLIAKQKSYQDAQNKRILAVLEQTETALINAQSAVDDINQNQTKLTDGALETIHNLQPMLTETTVAIRKAGETISDPAIKKSLDNTALTTANMAAVTQNVAKTTEHIEKKVADLTKPVSWVKQIFTSLIHVAANARTLLGY